MINYTDAPANKTVQNREKFREKFREKIRNRGYETKSSTQKDNVLFDDGNEWKRLITDLENVETNKEEPKMIEPKVPQHVTHHHDSIDTGIKIFRIISLTSIAE